MNRIRARARYQVHVFGLWHLVTNRAAASMRVYRRDQRRCGKRCSGLWSAEFLESAEKLRIFRRRYIVGILTDTANISI